MAPPDTEAPVLIAPGTQTAGTEDGKATASIDVTGLGSVSDNVDSSLPITYKVGSTILTGAYVFPLGATTVTMDAQDAAGNNATQQSFTVRVEDGEAPVLTAPSTAPTANTDSGKATASIDVTGLGSGSDNVDSSVTITYKVGATPLTGAFDFPVGATTVTMDAQDAAGNNATQQSFSVTVSDNEVPVLTAPSAQVADTESGKATASIDVTSLGSVSDNVDSTLSITYKVGATTLTGAYDFPLGATTVTMDAADSAGNDAVQVNFTVTVSDAGGPVLVAPSAQTANAEPGKSTASIDVTSLGSVSDNVDSTLSIIYKVGATTLTGAYDFPVGVTTVTMDAADSAGNDATQVSFTVTVSDVDVPVLTAPSAQTADTDDGANTASLDVTSLGSVSDNVDSNLAITYKVGATTLTGAFDFPVGETTVTMDATDSAGNNAVQVSFTVTVTDVSAPPVPTVAEVTVNADRTLTVTGTTEPAAIVTVTFPDGSTATTVASGGLGSPLRAAAPVNGASLAQPTGSFSVVSAAPQPSGNVTVTATDASGNTSGSSLTVVDTTAPDVVISGGPERLERNASFDVTITFSETVTGFAANDITASNGSVTALTGSGAVYTATIASTGAGSVSLSVAAGAAADAAGNVTTASNTLVIADTTVEETQKTIASFMYNRANQLIANQPDLTDFLSGTGDSADGSLNMAVTRGTGHFNLSSGANRNFWFRLQGAWSKDGTADSQSAFGAFGGHIHLRETVLLGGMLQFDHLSQDDGAARVQGTGWLAGPYMVAKLPGEPLYFEGRLLYGKSSNSVSPFGTYEDDFDTSRLLAQIKVTGEILSQDTLFSPYLNAAYLKEDQDAYTDSLGNVVSAQTIDLMQIALGLDAERTVAVQSGVLTLRGGVSGIWSSTGGTAVAETVLPGYAGWRGKLDIGLSHVSDSYGTFTASAFLDGLGASDYQSYGVSIGYSLAF
ncbi:HYR domain-containing protein [Pseudophaeobacter sp.]|uniref:HYR domain-containing protein n=1 Tax=Pseudophaeobacter sp. TaxID=1971739 RepID=UPI002624CC10|nr:HYR domain-containing protein [Pseudophaeobacter sp.]